MKRCASLLLLFLAASPVAAQDIALSQILIDGQGWQRLNPSPVKPGTVGSSVVGANGFRYTIEDAAHAIIATKKGAPSVMITTTGLTHPAGMTFWPDGRTLVVGDAEGKHLWAFRSETNGALTCGDGYYALRVNPGQTASGVSALTVDARGLLYACTPLGVQIFDPTGRLCGVLTRADKTNATAIWFSGPDSDQLYVAHGATVYARKIKARGVAPVENKK